MAYWTTEHNRFYWFWCNKEIIKVEGTLELSSGHSYNIVAIWKLEEIVPPAELLAKKVQAYIAWKIESTSFGKIPLRPPEDVEQTLTDFNKNRKIVVHHVNRHDEKIVSGICRISVDWKMNITRRELQSHRSLQLKYKLKEITERLSDTIVSRNRIPGKTLDRPWLYFRIRLFIMECNKNLKRPVVHKPLYILLCGGYEINRKRQPIYYSSIQCIFPEQPYPRGQAVSPLKFKRLDIGETNAILKRNKSMVLTKYAGRC